MAWWGKHKELSEDEVNLHALLLHSRFRAHKHRRPISRRLYRAILVVGSIAVIGAGLFYVLF